MGREERIKPHRFGFRSDVGQGAAEKEAGGEGGKGGGKGGGVCFSVFITEV